MLYYFFCVIPRRLNFMCRRFGTLCLFHLHRCCKQEEPSIKMEQTECSETSENKIQTLGSQPKERLQFSVIFNSSVADAAKFNNGNTRKSIITSLCWFAWNRGTNLSR